MRVLWLTNTPCGASSYLNLQVLSGGWMTSLEREIKNVPNLELAVCFFHNGFNGFKFDLEGVSYYPISNNSPSLANKVLSKLFTNLVDHNIPGIKKAIDDFQPDIIQLFGTESGLGEIMGHTDIPVIVHLQGLINPYLSAWFPKGVSKSTILAHSRWRDTVKLSNINTKHSYFSKMAEREVAIIKSGRHFFGRTKWDERILKLFNPDAIYYHCDEMLRREFFRSEWQQSPAVIFKMVSTIKPNIYKGLEIILETASILKKNNSFRFEWVVMGANADSQAVKLFESIKRLKFADNNIVFKGAQPGDHLVEELLKADVFIHPSHIDNSPNSVCEAMLLGMPVIAGNVGGVPSLVTDNENGFLYNSHDPYELAAIILEKAANPAELRAAGKKARTLAFKRHDPGMIVSTILATYKKIIEESGEATRGLMVG